MLKHKHHIIPKHAGGTDCSENIIELTVEEHADAHRTLWEEHQRWQDYVAWKALSSKISCEEAVRLSQKNADKTWMRTEEGKQKLRDRWAKRRKTGKDTPWNKGLTKNDHPSIMKLSEVNLKNREEGKLINIGDIVRGTKFSEDHKNKLSKKASQRNKIVCQKCKNSFTPGMFSRWHGDKCNNLISDETDPTTLGSSERRR